VCLSRAFSLIEFDTTKRDGLENASERGIECSFDLELGIGVMTVNTSCIIGQADENVLD
jgi:hypothetical protein